MNGSTCRPTSTRWPARLFHLLSGAPPYNYPSAGAVITKHVMAEPPSIGELRPEFASLDPVFAKAMAKKPADRFARCQDFAQELQRHLYDGAAAHPTQLASDPSQATLLAPTPPAAPKDVPRQSRWRPEVVIPAALAVAAVIAVVVAAVLLLPRDKPAVSTDAQAADPAVTAGPFTGTYTVDFTETTTLSGKVSSGTTPAPETWVVKSACRTTGCVATATVQRADASFESTFVFDEVNGEWLAVTSGSGTCNDRPDQRWGWFTLRPQPDGSLRGEHFAVWPIGCSNKQSVTLRRSGDVDPNTQVADPALQPPRVISPAEALQGNYRLTMTMPTGQTTVRDRGGITRCLRTGDRCISPLMGADGKTTILVFAEGKWTGWAMDDAACTGQAGRAFNVFTDEFPLPHPPQDPITLLTGHGRVDSSGDCPYSTDFDQKLERTGD